MRKNKSEIRGQKSVASRKCLPGVAPWAKTGHSCGLSAIAPGATAEGGNPEIKAVLFDFDGTLTVPGLIDFLAVKKEIHCPDNSTILEFIGNLSSENEREKALAVLVKYEERAARMAKPNANAEEIVRCLGGMGVKLGILTRNSMRSVKTALKSFRRVSLKDFHVVITREHALKLKPHPEGVLEAGRLFGVKPHELMVVGDYIYDIQAGQRAGALTVFIESGHTTKWPAPPADWTIKGLDELKGIF